MPDLHAHTSLVSYGLVWSLPFLGLLLSIAVAPLLVPRVWHDHYGKFAAFWAAAFILPDAVSHGAGESIAALLGVALHEYLPFVLLLGALFVATGGLRVTGTPRGTPAVNTALLALGTVLASCIGTTGAAMLMLRPLLRANRFRRRTNHIYVFFIFLVANVGGALTPLGDPPLFLGYLQGVPFLWPTAHLLLPTLVMAGGMLAMFYAIDNYVHRRRPGPEPEVLPEIEKLGVHGGVNLLLIAAVIATVLLRGAWRPDGEIVVLGVPWPLGEVATDALLLIIAVLSLVLTGTASRRANQFSWGPMVEVAILFAAIFVAIIPVMAIIAAGPAGAAAPLLAELMDGSVPDDSLFYWATGMLSAFLDNAPTYLVFFGFAGGDAARLTGPLASTLTAISAGAVFFGAFTYLGNAPNLMVRAIVESQGIRMPSFLGYMGWAAICLLPWLMLVDMVFFR